jgi:hypothetical protein
MPPVAMTLPFFFISFSSLHTPLCTASFWNVTRKGMMRFF